MTARQPQRSIIVVHPDFDRTWPWAADHFRVLWEAQGQTEFFRLAPDDRRAVCEIVADPPGVTRLVALNVPVTVECATRMQALREAVFSPGPSAAIGATLARAGRRARPGRRRVGRGAATSRRPDARPPQRSPHTSQRGPDTRGEPRLGREPGRSVRPFGRVILNPIDR
jgi:hypothetical protein